MLLLVSFDLFWQIRMGQPTDVAVGSWTKVRAGTQGGAALIPQMSCDPEILQGTELTVGRNDATTYNVLLLGV